MNRTALNAGAMHLHLPLQASERARTCVCVCAFFINLFYFTFFLSPFLRFLHCLALIIDVGPGVRRLRALAAPSFLIKPSIFRLNQHTRSPSDRTRSVIAVKTNRVTSVLLLLFFFLSCRFCFLFVNTLNRISIDRNSCQS